MEHNWEIFGTLLNNVIAIKSIIGPGLAFNFAIISSKIHVKQLNLWSYSSASQSCGELQLAVCLSRGDGAI